MTAPVECFYQFRASPRIAVRKFILTKGASHSERYVDR